jgi:uncharacterized protein YuzE
MIDTPNDIEIDEEADAAYVRLSGESVARTQRISDDVIVDFDAHDHLVGVEVLSLRDRVPRGDYLAYLRGLVEGLQLGPARTAAE